MIMIVIRDVRIHAKCDRMYVPPFRGKDRMGAPCPSDPQFPAIDDYDFQMSETDSGWLCIPVPKTRMARALRLSPASGATASEARATVVRLYREAAECWRASEE